MILIPALWKQKKADLGEFKAILVYKVSPRQPGYYTEKSYLKKQNQKTKNKQKPMGEVKLLSIEGFFPLYHLCHKYLLCFFFLIKSWDLGLREVSV